MITCNFIDIFRSILLFLYDCLITLVLNGVIHTDM